MKLVPILAIMNALTLGLLILLFVEQGELETQLKAARSGTVRSVGNADLEERIASLERRGREPWAPPVPSDTSDSATIPVEGGRANAIPANGDALGDDPERPLISGEEMEVFRRNVRRANELNREEERVGREVERLDTLISSQRIASLTKRQKENVARLLLGARDKVPGIWQRMRDDQQLRELPREERFQVLRSEYEALRADTQKELEKLVQPADAKTIIDTSLSERGRGWPFGGGGGSRRPRRNAESGDR